MAERKISTKFAIEGESEYKNAVKGINQEMKVLNSEMAKTASEFSSAQNSMEALSAKSEVLAKQFETQSQRVETMREALQNAQNAQQEWADKQEEATARVEELNRQLEELKQAEGDTTEEQERLTQELQNANDALEYANRGYEAATKGVDDWQTRLNYAEADLNKLNDQIRDNDRLMEEAKNSTDGCAQSIDQYGKATKEAGDRSEGMGAQGAAAISKIIGSGGGGMAGLLGFALKLVGTVKDLAIETKNAEAIMVRGTGAQGEALQELNDVYQDVMATAKSASDAVAQSIAILNTRVKLTGEDLTNAAISAEKFARATGTDEAAALNLAIDLMNAYGKTAADLPDIFDKLTVAGQHSRNGVMAVGQATADAAFYAQEFGWSLDRTLGTMTAFDVAGQDTNSVVRVMQKSFNDLRANGQTLDQVFEGLENGTISEADALDMFGKKGGQVIQFLREGKIDVESNTEAILNSAGAMEAASENAETFADKWRGFWNSVWHGGESGSQYTGFYEVQLQAEETTEVLEEELQPSVEGIMQGFTDLAVEGEFTAEKIGTLSEYLLENRDALIEEGFAVDDVIGALVQAGAQLAQLEAETEKATEGVESNLDSLMGRFNEVPATVETSVAQVVHNLGTQLDYMEKYADNMQKAAARGVNEGLLKSLADGSQESAAILAGLVNATDEDIGVLNAKWNKTQEGRENFSRTMGEIQTDFDQRKSELEASYDEAVEHFNQYSEAQAAGAKTMQGVIDGASSMGRPLNNTYYNLGKGAAQQFNAGFNSIPAPQPNRGYASGTLSAAPGWAWTGETGPELILFRGGETVINHQDSMRLAQAALEAQLRAERKADGDLSVPSVVVNTQSGTDTRNIETLIAGVISAVRSIEPVDLGAIAGGVDRQLAHQRKLVGMAGG